MLIWLVVTAAFAALCVTRPQAGRIAVGRFFLAMALGVNGAILIWQATTGAIWPLATGGAAMNGANMTARKVLLGCGIVSSVLYVASDVLATLRYPGYSYINYTISELLAAGAPTRPLMVALVGIPYGVLVAAFAVGVWTSAGRQRAARITGALLVGYAAAGMAGGVLFPTIPRGTEGTLRNLMHIPATAVMSLFLVLSMGFGATLLGKRFRYYSYGTIVTLLVFGALAGLQGGRLAANQPTPWMGVEERINIYATMLWLAVLAVALFRVHGTIAPRHLGKPTVTLQGVPR